MTTSKGETAKERDARLKEALRANLRRRKAQARGRKDTGALEAATKENEKD